MRIYKPKEIADEMLAGATTQETGFCLASDVAALRKAQRQFELRLLDEIELLAELRKARESLDPEVAAVKEGAQ